MEDLTDRYIKAIEDNDIIKIEELLKLIQKNLSDSLQKQNEENEKAVNDATPNIHTR